MQPDSSPLLITGGAGFIGSNLVDHFAARGYRVRVFDALCRPGVEANLEWLVARHGDLIEPVIGDIRDRAKVEAATRGVQAMVHLAAQVAVTTSMETPRHDLEVNLLGTFNLMESLRTARHDAPVLFASTNKVYGDLADRKLEPSSQGYVPADPQLAAFGVSERAPLDFHTPYGCSKGAADQYVLDYARSYGMRAAVLRMSCIYGQRQMGNEDQGWVAHFLIQALTGQPITLFGDGRQVRDICDVRDTCAAYAAALDRIDSIRGRALNWGGGPENAVSLLTVIAAIERITGCRPEVQMADWRPGDQRWFVADTRLADDLLGLPSRRPWQDGLVDLARWLEDRHSPGAEPHALQRARA